MWSKGEVAVWWLIASHQGSEFGQLCCANFREAVRETQGFVLFLSLFC